MNMATFIAFKKTQTKCHCCGKFIKNEDMRTGKALNTFVPDSHFTIEEDIYNCPECSKTYGHPVSDQPFFLGIYQD